MSDQLGFHKGDRVVSSATGQHGIVEGWKDDKVLVLWGVNNKVTARSWEPRFSITLCPDPVKEAGTVIWKGTSG